MGLGEIWNYPLSKKQVRWGCSFFLILTLLTLRIDWIHVENNYRIGGLILLLIFASIGTFVATFVWTHDGEKTEDGYKSEFTMPSETEE